MNLCFVKLNKCCLSRSLNSIVILNMTTFVSYFLLRPQPQLLRQRTVETADWNGGYVRIYCPINRGVWRKTVVQIEAWTQNWYNVAVAVLQLSVIQHWNPETSIMIRRGSFYLVDQSDILSVIWRCMHRASSYNMYINQQVAQNSCD